MAMKKHTKTMLARFSQYRVVLLPLLWWFVIVGRKETKTASHQKKRVAGTSSIRAMSFHFLLPLVKALAMSPTI